MTTTNFINNEVSESDMRIRLRLYKSKNESMKKNPNLFQSDSRLCFRNLPRTGFEEADLKAMIKEHLNTWKNSLTEEQTKEKELNKKKLIHQVLVMKNEETVLADGSVKGSGMAYAEIKDTDAVIYLIRAMNNIHLSTTTNKGLIVDFAIEDHRKLHKRQLKADAREKRTLTSKREEKIAKKEEEEYNYVPDVAVKKEPVTSTKPVHEISDIPLLRKMLKTSNSRGKK